MGQDWKKIERQRFTIRKTRAWGACSVFLGSSIFFLGGGVASAQEVSPSAQDQAAQVAEAARVSDEKESEKPATESQAEPEKNAASVSADVQATEAKEQAAPSTEDVVKAEEAAVSKDEKSEETNAPKEAKAEEKAEPKKEEKSEPKTASSETNAAAQPKRSGSSGFRSVSGTSGFRNTGATRQGSDYTVTQDGNLATVQANALKTQLDRAASENLPVTPNQLRNFGTATTDDERRRLERQAADLQNTEAQAMNRKISDYLTAKQRAQQLTGREGSLQQIAPQNLVFSDEPNATARIRLAQGDWFVKDSTLTSRNQYVREALDSRSYNEWRDGTTTQPNAVITRADTSQPAAERIIKDQTDAYYMVHTQVGRTTTVEYTLHNSFAGGRPITKAIARYTPKKSSAYDDSMVMAIHKDPTMTVWNGSSYDRKGTGNQLHMEWEFYYADGTKVDFGRTPGVVSFASRNHHGNDIYAEIYGNLSSNMQNVQIVGSSIVPQANGWYYANGKNNSYKGQTEYQWDQQGNPNEFWGAGAAKVTSGTSLSFDIATTNPGQHWPRPIRQWFSFNTNVKANNVVTNPNLTYTPAAYVNEVPAPEPEKSYDRFVMDIPHNVRVVDYENATPDQKRAFDNQTGSQIVYQSR